VGVNPKINNMNQGYKAAKYDLLWICDSAIKGIIALCREIMLIKIYIA
jgi:hypothetical protein